MRFAHLLLAAALVAPVPALAHVTVWPRQSELGARERYVVRTPNEKRVATVRVEAQFPPEVRIVSLEQKAGWRIEVKRNAAGDISGAVWTGELPPDQFTEFGVMAINPKAGQSTTWLFTQVYADGTTVEWTGPAGSRTPAPQVVYVPAATPDEMAHH